MQGPHGCKSVGALPGGTVPGKCRAGRIFVRHPKVLRAQWIPAKREHHARQFLYVPLPGLRYRELRWIDPKVKLSETFWNILKLEIIRNLLGIF